jgi:hypothetical protein
MASGPDTSYHISNHAANCDIGTHRMGTPPPPRVHVLIMLSLSLSPGLTHRIDVAYSPCLIKGRAGVPSRGEAGSYFLLPSPPRRSSLFLLLPPAIHTCTCRSARCCMARHLGGQRERQQRGRVQLRRGVEVGSAAVVAAPEPEGGTQLGSESVDGEIPST